ncbi:MAG: PRD domain-containing protein [Corynebacterium sp.]|nr:PRD domain-containing protein [Corynebacterium sp.]
MWKIQKVFNNNVLMAEDAQGQVAVLLGRGLGFGAKAGDQVDETRIHQVLRPEAESPEQFTRLVAELSPELIALTVELTKSDGEPTAWADSAVVALADHIRFAIDRAIAGIELPNPLAWEIEQIYPDEYAFGQRCVAKVKEATGVELPRSEVTSIALHAVNAQISQGQSRNFAFVTKVTDLIAQSVETVRETLGISGNSLALARFTTHLRYLVQRVVRKDTHTLQSDPTTASIHDMMSKEHPSEMAIASKILINVEFALEADCGEAELTYLTLHILRLKQEAEKSH